MAGPRLRIQLDQNAMRVWEERLSDMQTRLSILTPAYKAMGKVFRAAMGTIFLTAPKSSTGQGGWRQRTYKGIRYAAPPVTYAAVGYNREQWKVLSPGYAAWKIRRAGNVPILWFSSEMARSFFEEGHPQGVEKLTPTYAEFGSKSILAYYHQTVGAGKSRVKRKIIAMTKAEVKQFIDILLRYIIGGRPEG